MTRDPSPSTFTERQRSHRQSCCNANIAKQNRFSFAGTNKKRRSSSGAGSSLQNLVLQKTRSRKSRFKQKPIFSSLCQTPFFASHVPNNFVVFCSSFNTFYWYFVCSFYVQCGPFYSILCCYYFVCCFLV